MIQTLRTPQPNESGLRASDIASVYEWVNAFANLTASPPIEVQVSLQGVHFSMKRQLLRAYDATISANETAWAIDDLDLVRATATDDNLLIQGITRGYHGRRVEIWNVGTRSFFVAHQSSEADETRDAIECPSSGGFECGPGQRFVVEFFELFGTEGDGFWRAYPPDQGFPVRVTALHLESDGSSSGSGGGLSVTWPELGHYIQTDSFPTIDPDEGENGDYAIAAFTGGAPWPLYGPKESGVWPGSEFGALPASNYQGHAPTSSDGNDGEYWADTSTSTLWGPRSSTGSGSSASSSGSDCKWYSWHERHQVGCHMEDLSGGRTGERNLIAVNGDVIIEPPFDVARIWFGGMQLRGSPVSWPVSSTRRVPGKVYTVSDRDPTGGDPGGIQDRWLNSVNGAEFEFDGSDWVQFFTWPAPVLVGDGPPDSSVGETGTFCLDQTSEFDTMYGPRSGGDQRLVPIYYFDAGQVSGAGLIVEESDGTPAVHNVSTIAFDQDAGFRVIDQGDGTALVTARGTYSLISDVRCVDGVLKVYKRTMNGGQLGDEFFSHNAGCCDCDTPPAECDTPPCTETCSECDDPGCCPDEFTLSWDSGAPTNHAGSDCTDCPSFSGPFTLTKTGDCSWSSEEFSLCGLMVAWSLFYTHADGWALTLHAAPDFTVALSSNFDTSGCCPDELHFTISNGNIVTCDWPANMTVTPV